MHPVITRAPAGPSRYVLSGCSTSVTYPPTAFTARST